LTLRARTDVDSSDVKNETGVDLLTLRLRTDIDSFDVKDKNRS
jgi:hypothetical protein